MGEYATKLITDLPEQFKGKERIEALMAVIGRQFDDLKQFYDDLNTKRTIDTAEGAQLDMIGDILGLTRTQAGTLISDNTAVQDDETYRYILKYKIAQNSNVSTYYDIARGLQLLFDASAVTYSEDPSEPARITVSLSSAESESIISSAWSTLMVKPAGVAVYFNNKYAENAPLFFGIVTIVLHEANIGSVAEEVSAIDYLADENGYTFMDELNNVLGDGDELT